MITLHLKMIMANKLITHTSMCPNYTYNVSRKDKKMHTYRPMYWYKLGLQQATEIICEIRLTQYLYEKLIYFLN